MEEKQNSKKFDDTQKKAFYQLLLFGAFIVIALLMIVMRPSDANHSNKRKTTLSSHYVNALRENYNYAFTMKFTLPDGRVLVFDGKRNGRRSYAKDQDGTEYFIETVNTYQKKEGEEEYTLVEENVYLSRFSLEQMIVLLQDATLDDTQEESEKITKKYHYEDATMVTVETQETYEIILQIPEFALQIIYSRVNQIEELSM